METTQEPRKQQLAAAVSSSEKKAVELAVQVDSLGSVSEALRTRSVQDLIDRGAELLEQLRTLGAAS